MRIILILAVLAACFAAMPALAEADDDDLKPLKTENVSTADQAGSISLDRKSQQLAGIKTELPAVARQQPEFTVYGTVLGLEPLVQLRQQYLSARAQQDSAKAKYTEADFNLSRTRNLHQQDIVSTRRLQEQQAQWQSDKANLAASAFQQQTVLAASRLEWGDLLTDWFVLKPGKAAEQFFSHRSLLLQITLPAHTRLGADMQSVYVDEQGRRQTAVKAELISRSPRIDPVSQGERYFYKAEGRSIPFGAHITAWIANDAAQNNGVLIPKAALVWHLGQACVFVRKGDHFSRRALQNYTPVESGYFVIGTVRPEEEIVTTGGQTLLSQQLKAQIPNEDAD